MSGLEKLEKAKELMQQAELDLIKEKGFCPYELAFALKNLEEVLENLRKEIY